MDTSPAATLSTTRLRAFRTPVRGHAFAPRPPGTTGPVPGQLARLIREPGNPADPYAIGVWVADGHGRWRIGYLDRGVAVRLAPRLDGGADLVVQVEGWTTEPEGRWQRPVVVVQPPDGSNDAPRPTGLWGRPPGVARRVVRRADQASSPASSYSSASSSSSSSSSSGSSSSGSGRVPTSMIRSCGT